MVRCVLQLKSSWRERKNEKHKNKPRLCQLHRVKRKRQKHLEMPKSHEAEKVIYYTPLCFFPLVVLLITIMILSRHSFVFGTFMLFPPFLALSQTSGSSLMSLYFLEEENCNMHSSDAAKPTGALWACGSGRALGSVQNLLGWQEIYSGGVKEICSSLTHPLLILGEGKQIFCHFLIIYVA